MGRLWDILTGESKKRTAEMKEFAYAKEAKFAETDEFGLIAQLSEFKLFKFGSRKKINNLIYQKDILENLYLFDYEYTVSTGNSSARFQQTYKFYDSKSLKLPEFRLKPEGFFTKLVEWFGGSDIDFESDYFFSDSFHLTGEYESIIRKYFDENIRRLCLSNKEFYMDGVNYYLGIYVKNKVLKGEELKAFDKLTDLLFELFKLRSTREDQLGLSS